MKNWLKLLLALLLLPTVFFAGVETLRGLIGALAAVRDSLTFGAGIAAYLIIHFWLYDFSRVYVFGHEVTHAVAAMLCGYRVKGMSVKSNNGYVKMDDCNAFVALAPYFVPAYVALAGLIYAGVSLFTDASPYRPVFVFLVGFFMTFHFVQTFKTLFETDQPDLKMAGGRIFSAVMIVFVNLLVLVLVLKALFPASVHLLEMARNTFNGTYNTWKIVINYIVEHLFNRP